MSHNLKPSTELSRRIAEAYPGLSGGHRRVADYVLRHPLDSATLTIEQLATRAGTSSATLTRFVRALGYAHFSDFRAALGAALKLALTPVTALSEAKRNMAETPASVFFSALATQGANLAEVGALNEAGTVEGVVAALLSARRIYLLGAGASHHAASYLEDGLVLYLGPKVVLASSRGGLDRAMNFLISAGPEDLVIAFSIRRYSKQTLELFAFAGARGPALVAITDAATSPVAGIAGTTLFAPSHSGYLPNSPTALFAVADALIAAVAQARPGAVEALRELSAGLVWTFQD